MIKHRKIYKLKELALIIVNTRRSFHFPKMCNDHDELMNSEPVAPVW